MLRPLESNIITEKESVALKQFKENIPDILSELCEYRRHDVWLVNWLRARELDVQKAEAMIRKHMVFRKEILETIMEFKVPEMIDKHCAVKVCGFDKNGVLTGILPVGKIDYRLLLSSGLKAELHQYIAQVFEQSVLFLKQNSTKERLCTQVNFIMDYEGFELRQLASRDNIDFFIEFIRFIQDNYPDVLKTAFVINAPKIFEVLFAMIKPLLSTRTLGKIRIFGSNAKHWRSVLLEDIDPDQLPSQYGGSVTTCRDYRVVYGLDWYHTYETLPENEMIPVTVDAYGKHCVKFSLSEGSKLTWNFRSVDYDIGFSVLCPKEGVVGATGPIINTGEQELFKCSRVDSHLHLQKGGILADKPGTYTLVFDNSYSRFRKKEILYVTRVESPKIIQ